MDKRRHITEVTFPDTGAKWTKHILHHGHYDFHRPSKSPPLPASGVREVGVAALTHDGVMFPSCHARSGEQANEFVSSSSQYPTYLLVAGLYMNLTEVLASLRVLSWDCFQRFLPSVFSFL